VASGECRPARLALVLALPFPFGVCRAKGKARQGKARHDKAFLSAASARIIGRWPRDAEFHVAGCRRTVDSGLERRREALAVAAMIGRA